MLKELFIFKGRKIIKEVQTEKEQLLNDDFFKRLLDNDNITEEEKEALMAGYKSEVTFEKAKHYGKYVLGAAIIGGLGYLAIQALKDDDIESDDVIEGVFEELGD